MKKKIIAAALAAAVLLAAGGLLFGLHRIGETTISAGPEPAAPEEVQPAEPEEPKPLGVTVAITGGSVYVRVGNGTNYRIITTVKAGMTFDHVATARNGWNAIAVNGQVGWVSGKYSAII